MKKIIIIAGNHSQYINFVSYVLPHTKDNFVEADHPNKLAGVLASAVIKIGTCVDRKDYREMCRLADSRII